MASNTKRLLCTTDGSKASDKAVRYAARFARELGADLTFITVNVGQHTGTPGERVWDTELVRLGESQVERELRAAAEAAKEEGLDKVRCVEVHNHNIPAAVIDYAEKNDIDHIVAGSTGRTGVARLLVGSVAQEIVAKAHCPVTIIR
ncbi:universal stress protein [Ferruginivarius sediminum]|uniref:Universal stress protein n=1 Tax=Ferruginivarius sediminum TaxID=2661937 RepID=A0A369TA23_9PROT|nr:universal stress protein [Ferruginivarius sediminum]RDD61027.1 universal stress protein [Ferruginivarius sediminum]